jgi:hypothetical protein
VTCTGEASLFRSDASRGLANSVLAQQLAVLAQLSHTADDGDAAEHALHHRGSTIVVRFLVFRPTVAPALRRRAQVPSTKRVSGNHRGRVECLRGIEAKPVMSGTECGRVIR